ncbi:occludin-like isoform X3 [Hemitrygon akajei]|uniref:occludin-like isoform X3 n=1 Tax=Hemitrygon akajei TaxID=2704970 RepID=UPI003BFA1B21
MTIVWEENCVYTADGTELREGRILSRAVGIGASLPVSSRGSLYAPSKDMYDGDLRSHPAGSYYPDETQHFYKWSSPPGIIKILAVLIIVMSIGIFACVASTLPWDMDYYGGGMGVGNGMGYGGYGGYGGVGTGYGSGTGYGYGAGVGAYGYGGGYTDPRAAKGFMIALAAVSFITLLVVFIILVSRASLSRTRKFYLILIISCAVVGFIMFVATIVYIMGVNPTAQAAGSVFYNQLLTLCNQFYIPSTTGVFTNQYLYHYCVVEPQEVNNVSGVPEELVTDGYYKPSGSLNETEYEPNRVQPDGAPRFLESSIPLMHEQPPLRSSSWDSDESKPTTQRKPPRKRRPGRPNRPDADEYETDYTTGAESCDELDEEDLESRYPPITSDQQRQEYKREFDSDLQQYKHLQGDLDEINKQFSQLDKQIDEREDSELYEDIAVEYNRLKEVKNSVEYREKKKHCKQLKTKLAHIKQMVNNYDSQRS